jgi:hypothetical protein
MNENKQMQYIQEDEIDLRELFLKIWAKKLFILVFTFVITILAGIYAFMKTPIYEVKSNVQLGFIGDKEKLLNDPDSLNQELIIIFNVNEKSLNDKKANSWVEDISIDKKVKNYIQIKTNGLSNEEALNKNKKVVEYIQKQNQITIDNFIRNTKLSIEQTKKSLKYVDEIEIKDAKRQIEKLKTQKIIEIEKAIDKLKNQDIKNLKREINLIKTQKIPVIDDEIKVLNNKLDSISNKIKFSNKKLSEYNKSINELYKNAKNQSSAETMISSIQMLNYQNLVLNTQNKVEDLILEKNTIKTKLIPDLENKKRNYTIVTIEDLNKNIENINNIQIFNLEKEKSNIEDDTIKKLQEKIDITLRDKKISLENKIKNLEYQISNENYSNSKVVGNYVIYDYPIKPKKKLIVVVAFVTGFIISIFLVFLIDFFRGMRKEEDTSKL